MPKNDPPDTAKDAAAKPKASRAKKPDGAAPKRRAKASSRTEDDESRGQADEEGGEHERGDGDDDSTEVVAEVVDDDAKVAAIDGDDEFEESEPVDEDDEDAPRRKKVVAYADDPDSKDAALSRYDPMQAYLREVQRHALLTPDQELSLATKYWRDKDVNAAATLVTANLRLVVKIAYEYRRAYKNIMDLVQEGNVGLMQAVKKFDPTRGVKLSSYAAWWIRAYILRYILNNWRMVKLGTTQAQRKLFFNLNKEKQRLLALGIDPTAARIAERLNVEEKEVADMDVRLGASESSLDAPVGDTDGKLTPRVDLMPSAAEGADTLLADAEISQKLRAKLASFRETLKGKDLEIFDLRLVAPDEPLTLQELGDRFGVSRERVRQLEARLVGKLRLHMREELDEVSSG
jgi:RNA polymerase sigma-32 factor